MVAMTMTKLGRVCFQDIDEHIGARMRERRIMLGLTQQQLADLVGVTSHQMHKYETGFNQIKAGRLFTISDILDVEVGYFFQDINVEKPLRPSRQQRTLLDLAQNFTSISNERHREAIGNLARAMADPELVDEAEPATSEEAF